jgi:hypothetical protein
LRQEYSGFHNIYTKYEYIDDLPHREKYYSYEFLKRKATISKRCEDCLSSDPYNIHEPYMSSYK